METLTAGLNRSSVGEKVVMAITGFIVFFFCYGTFYYTRTGKVP